jgi:hypothetical protein
MNYLQLNKQWRLEQKDNELYVIGGQDAIFTIDLNQNTKSYFTTLKHNQKFKAEKLTPEDRIVLEQLLSAEVVTPTLKLIGKNAKPNIKVISKLSSFELDKSICQQVNGNSYDLLILVRTNETLSEFLQEYNYLEITKPHLFLDLAYNHTISLGPLVFPGVTSCIACLEGRISTRWGDMQPPPESRSTDELIGLSKEWLNVELKKLIKDEDYTLVNKTIVLDTQNRTMNSNKLLTVPLCPYCKKSELLSGGKLEYNFAKA